MPGKAAYVEALHLQGLQQRRFQVGRVVEPQHLWAALNLGKGLPVVVFHHGVVSTVDNYLVELHALVPGLFREAVAILARSQHDLLPRHEGTLAEQLQRCRCFDVAENDGLHMVGRAHAHLPGGNQVFHPYLGFLLSPPQRHRKDRDAQRAGDQDGFCPRGDVLVPVAEQHQPLGALDGKAGGTDLQCAGDVGGAAVDLGSDVGQAEALGNAVLEIGVGTEHDKADAVLRAFGATDRAYEVEGLVAHRCADAVGHIECKNDVGLFVGSCQGQAHQAADK